MAEVTRSSRLAMVEEVSEGTPVSPSAGTDYLALQDGFTMTPDFEVLVDESLRGDISVAKPILGQENPTAEISHYIKHSGVEASAPEDNLLLKNAYGSTSIRATERDTVAGSTVSVLNVDVGEGVEYSAGDLLRVQHSAFPHELAVVASVAGDALTLAFDLQNAPATGTLLGRNVKYTPANSRGSLSSWLYRANGAGVEMAAGMKVNSFEMTAEAGQLLNGSYTMNGLEFFYDPIEITASDVSLDFSDSGAAARVATISARMYKDPEDLRAALETAMNAAGSADTHTVTYSNSTGKYTISSDAAPFTLDWSTGPNSATSIGDAIGYVTGSDDTGSQNYEADETIHAPGGSLTGGLESPQVPSLNTSNPLAVKDNEIFLGDSSGENACASVQSLTYTMSNELTPVLDICATSGRSGQISSERSGTVDLVINLTRFDIETWKDFRENNTVKLQFNFGTRSGDNWTAGASGCLYIDSGTISSWEVTDTDGIVTIAATISTFGETAGKGEQYLNFV